MRHLTAAGAAAVLLAAGIGAASSASADPTMTDPTNTEVSTAAPAEPASTEPASTEPASTEPTSTEPTSTEPTSTEPTSTEPTSTESTSTEPEGARQVTYTVTTTSDLTANIYYVTTDPPAQSEANDPEYMPMARTMVGPGAPWTFQTTLEDPTQWAFVSASGGLRVNPEFRCEIAVDGQVVVSQQGGSGVQCALRPW
jgi:cytoskeletal protein RodZ